MLKEYIEKHRNDNNFNSSDILNIIVGHLDEHCEEKHCSCIIKKIHEQIYGKHFDEDCAIKTVNEMYFVKKGTNSKVYGAFISLEQANKIYSRVRDEINKAYNVFDFYVALNMIYSDNYNLFTKWFNDITEDTGEKMIDIVTDATVNWFNDVDSPYSEDSKIWCYLKR